MANVKVNQQQWNSISVTDQEAIINGLRKTGALKVEDSIVGDPTVPLHDEHTHLELKWNPLNDLCKIACDTAAGAGFAWCAANTAGIATAACMAAAEAARNECRNHC